MEWVKNSEHKKDLSNIKFVVSYFEKNKNVVAIKNIIETLNQYIKLEMYSNGTFADLSNLPNDFKEKIADCKDKIENMHKYINTRFIERKL